MDRLFLLSESRGKEASGIAALAGQEIVVYKQAVPASRLIRQAEYRKIIGRACDRDDFFMMGHSRLVTNGDKSRPENNQPVHQKGAVCIHNGIVVNVDELYKVHELERQCDIDSEVFLQFIHQHLNGNKSLPQAVRWAFAEIKGSASTAFLFEDFPVLILATNTGSIYYSHDPARGLFIFASEQFIVEQVLRQGSFKNVIEKDAVTRLMPGQAVAFSLTDGALRKFSLKDEAQDPDIPLRVPGVRIAPVASPSEANVFKNILKDNSLANAAVYARHFDERVKISSRLKRCVQCVLPESVPLISFDQDGVCSFCRKYVRLKPLGRDALEGLIRAGRVPGKPDCLVGLSGGRDSSYLLHFMKKVMGADVIAYTYDWGLVTDLARRNQARLCGQLGVEHILVSADIDRKRKNIRRNVTAWLKRPHLGMIPLFMAGDKQYFTYGYELKKKTGARSLILGENLLEKTGFKTGFCGVKESDAQLSYGMPLVNKLKMAAFYTKEFLANPAYLNSSLGDTFYAYLAYYVFHHEYINLYNYIPWEERVIDETLKQEYDWETARDMDSTWRIGDGTAAFYNYIYFMMAGFSEHDTLRSNQIREGVLSREEAVRLVQRDNQPRYETIKWYCDVIGLDMDQVLRRVYEVSKVN